MCVLYLLTRSHLKFSNRPPKISKPPAARPFFDQGSLVLDFYKGHLNAMIDRITQADFSFVMYYAPWDAESQTLRQEFENVARFYHSQVWMRNLEISQMFHFCANANSLTLCVCVCVLFLRYSSQLSIVGIPIRSAEPCTIKFTVIRY